MDYKIIKYHGNDQYFAALFEEKNIFYIIFALTNGISITENTDSEKIYGSYHTVISELIVGRTVNAEILFKKNPKLNTIFHIIKLNNEQEFDSIIKVLECIL